MFIKKYLFILFLITTAVFIFPKITLALSYTNPATCGGTITVSDSGPYCGTANTTTGVVTYTGYSCLAVGSSTNIQCHTNSCTSTGYGTPDSVSTTAVGNSTSGSFGYGTYACTSACTGSVNGPVCTPSCAEPSSLSLSASASYSTNCAACGSSNNQCLTSTPTSACASGSSSGIAFASNQWNWGCQGGDNVSCNAYLQGSCGGSNRASYYYGGPTGNYCSTGTMIGLTGGTVGPWSWQCEGSSHCTNATCSANLKIDGSCGPAAKTYPAGSTAYSGNKCNSGNATSNPSFPTTINSTATWTCSSTNGGLTSPTCTAILATPISVSKTYSCGSNSFSGSFCSTPYGSSPTNPAFPTVSNPSTWVCSGLNGGASLTCNAILQSGGICGTAEKTYPPGSTSFSGTMCVGGSPTPANPVFPNTSNIANGSLETSWTCPACTSSGAQSITCTAALSVNGQCGVASGVVASSVPTLNLCSGGTASQVSDLSGSGIGPWQWTCNSLNEQAAAPLCIDYVNGVCGSASDGALTKPSTNLCAPGIPTAVAGTGPWTWNCGPQPSGGLGSTDHCKAPLIGSCGSAAAGCYATAPTTNLCATGTHTAVQKIGLTFNGVTEYSWFWTCKGSATDGSGDAGCGAGFKAAAACGSSNGIATDTSPTNLCSVGTASAVTGGTSTNKWAWTCTGVCSGANASCSAPVDGNCGTANNVATTTTPPNSGLTLCSAGTASTVSPPFGSTPWEWSCVGTGGTGAQKGTTASCSASLPPPKGVCGPAANGQSFSTAPTTNLCSTGTDYGGVTGGGTGNWTWACSTDEFVIGTNPTSVSCSAPINGQCNPLTNNVAVVSAPTVNLCSTGTPSAVSGTGPWTWKCNGSVSGLYSGTTASCSAPVKILDGSCGTAFDVPSAIEPTTGLCSVGTPLNEQRYTQLNDWTWSCSGVNGGAQQDYCYAPIIYTAVSPSASSLTKMLYTCAGVSAPANSIYFSWVYNDNNDPDIGLLSSTLKITTVNDSSATPVFSDTINGPGTSDTLILSENPQVGEKQLAFSPTNNYYWWVMVTNKNNVSSDWIPGSSNAPFTTETHDSPNPVINIATVYPLVNQPVYFSATSSDPTKNSTCYDKDNNEIQCAYTWNFGDTSSSDNSDTKASTSHIYTSARGYTVNLKATDSDGNYCSVPDSVSVSAALSLPQWKEISPF